VIVLRASRTCGNYVIAEISFLETKKNHKQLKEASEECERQQACV
jgi:hypothetical protein